jgi:hypothetical protein
MSPIRNSSIDDGSEQLRKAGMNRLSAKPVTMPSSLQLKGSKWIENEHCRGADHHLGSWEDKESSITLHATYNEPLPQSSKATGRHYGYGIETRPITCNSLSAIFV